MFSHIKDNKGDANVSKMVIIAIVFVVGAILLVMFTSAFRGPIGHWFETVVLDWFDHEGKNGEFQYSNPFEQSDDEDQNSSSSNDGNDTAPTIPEIDNDDTDILPTIPEQGATMPDELPELP